MFAVILLIVILVAALLGVAVIIAHLIRGRDAPPANGGVPTSMAFLPPDIQSRGPLVADPEASPLAPTGEHALVGVPSEVDFMTLTRAGTTSVLGAWRDRRVIKRAKEALDVRTELMDAAREFKDAEAEFTDRLVDCQLRTSRRRDRGEAWREIDRQELETAKALHDAERAEYEARAASFRRQTAKGKEER